MARQTLTLWTQLDADEIRGKLGDLYADSIRLQNDTLHAVARARTLGISWEAIARELNMSRQAAWERWHHVERA